MAEERVQRRLATILAADVVGFSRLMEADETGTLATLKARRRDVLDPLVAQHHGRIFKTTGDGVLIEFASAVNALQCAIDLQQGMAAANGNQPADHHIVLRIGVNLGDVMVEGSDLYGEGVNIAARLETMAEPGGILVSGTTYDHIKSKVKVGFDDLGAQSLRNIVEPVRAYRVTSSKPKDDAARGLQSREALPLPNKPSIAVLPFQNMSGDVDQEYFADGMVEEIITALSRSRWLFVIARNSSFAYKGRSVDAKQVGRELGVRYLLEGSVRRAGNRVRITGQLIDAGTGAHLWAERFDGRLEDIFDLQDQVTASVVGAIAPKLEQAEIERARRKPTESLDAYDYFLRGMAAFHEWTRDANNEALQSFYKAIELDPNFAAAYAMAARCYSQSKSCGWLTDPAHAIAETARLARRAGELGRDDAGALCSAGSAIAFVVGDLDAAAGYVDRALALNPNLAWAWLSSGLIKVMLGEPEVAIEHAAQAMRLSPHDTQVFVMQTIIGFAHFFGGRYAEALSWAERATREHPEHIPATCVAAASGALTGNRAAAESAVARLHQLMPELRMCNLKEIFPIRRPDHFERWAEAMRKAGLPE
jgi:TolB-like protein/class 3 adenylate cyclase